MTHPDLNALHVLKPREVARKYRIADVTVYDAIKVGELPAARFGKTFRVLQSDAEAWFLARTGRSASKEVN